MGLIWSIIIGLAAGAIAGWIMRGRGFGMIINLIVGLIGGLLGSWIFVLLGLAMYGILGSLISAVAGAVILLWILSLFKRKV